MVVTVLGVYTVIWEQCCSFHTLSADTTRR